MAYDSAVITFTTKTDKVDLVQAAHMNAVQAELVTIETILGTNVKGDRTDLKTRLNNALDADGSLLSGTSYPSPSYPSQPFYKTDVDLFYIRNAANSAWTSVTAVPTTEYVTAGSVSFNTETTVVTVDKTISAGKTVLLIATGYGYMDGTTSYVTLRLKAGGSTVQTIKQYDWGVSTNNEQAWTCHAIVTGLSGTTTFLVSAQSPQAGTMLGSNLTVMEF
jgi:hypothetical protein